MKFCSRLCGYSYPPSLYQRESIILVNNAGAYPLRGWMEAPPEEWIQNYDTNVFSIVPMIWLLVTSNLMKILIIIAFGNF
ncbi:hypothetical protein NIES4071_34830 [Calothrix sp. NIES-4071]|nr:hypothetical protein NIES4071_34830 [Calothrix sp. NIES-4071]BAZ57802.1 hypothetical protein NIES4105_34760 [Calothrix sp. NIES-4105]